MKKALVVMAALAIMLVFWLPVSAVEESEPIGKLSRPEWVPDMSAPIADEAPEDVTNTGGSQIDFQPIEEGGRFKATIYNVKLTNKKVGGSYDPEVVRIASGILHAAKVAGNSKVVSEYLLEARPENGNLPFTIANFAKAPGVPVVEHLWGIGKSKDDDRVKYLVLNPDSPWVIYEKTSAGAPDLETLAIGILMCPEGKAVPGKSLNKGKIVQGKHPELADACK